MARRHWDGFTAYTVVTDLDHLYTRGGAGATSNIAIVHDGGPYGNGSVRFGEANSSDAHIYRNFTASSTLILGLWFKCLEWDFTDADTYDEVISFGSSANGELNVRLGSDYSIGVYSGSTKLYLSSVAADNYDGSAHYFSPGVEYRIELKFFLDSLTGTVELRINGVVWALLSNIDTVYNNTTYNRVYFGVAAGGDGGGAQFEIAEVYLFDNTGTYANDFLTEWRASILRPTADAAASDFTPLGGGTNEAEVDETGKHDQDASYNSSSTNGHIDRFTTTDTISPATAAVHAVNVIMAARHDGTASNMRTKLRHSASDQNGSTVAAVNEDYKLNITTSDTNPSTSAQWTRAELHAAEFGYEKMA